MGFLPCWLPGSSPNRGRSAKFCEYRLQSTQTKAATSLQNDQTTPEMTFGLSLKVYLDNRYC